MPSLLNGDTDGGRHSVSCPLTRHLPAHRLLDSLPSYRISCLWLGDILDLYWILPGLLLTIASWSPVVRMERVS